MFPKIWIDRRSFEVIRSQTTWLPGVLIVHAIAVILSTFGIGDYGQVPTGTPIYVKWAIFLFQLVLVGVGVVTLGKTSLRFWDTWNELNKFIERIWNIAKKGSSCAALVGDDLGKPDCRGIYTRITRSGAKLYLRMARGSMSGDNEPRIWQWSWDKRLWTATAKVDQYWTDKSFLSGMAEKILLRRLEVESAFREKLPFLDSSVHPPPIELGIDEEEKRRLAHLTPQNFLCPISMEIMTQPVVTPSGITYDNKSLSQWIETHHSDPATQAPLKLEHLYPNLALRDMIQEWLVNHQFLGA